MSEESKTCFWVLSDNIISGNRYFRLEGKSYYFNRNMPLEEPPNGQEHHHEGNLRRGAETAATPTAR